MQARDICCSLNLRLRRLLSSDEKRVEGVRGCDATLMTTGIVVAVEEA